MEKGQIAKQNKKQKKEDEHIHSLTQIIKGAGIVFFGMVLGKIIGFFYTMIVARIGTEQFGLLNLGLSVVSLVVIFSLLGFDSGILRYIPYYHGKGDKSRIKGALTSSFRICLPLSIFLMAIVLIFSPYIAVSFFHNQKLIPILRIFALMIPFSVVTTLLLASFRAFRRVDYQVGLNEIAEKVIRLLTTFLLISWGFGILGATYSYLISIVLICIISLFILEKRVFPVFDKKIKSVYYFKELSSYSLPLMFANIMIFLIAWTDTLMLGYFRTASEVGIYNAAHSTAALIFILPTGIISLFLPILMGFYSNKRYNQIKKFHKTVSRWIFLFNFPVFLVLAIFPTQIIRIIFGREYTAAALPLAILVFGYILYSLAYTSSNIIGMAKKTGWILLITIILAASNILLNFLLIPLYGVNGAAVATSISYIIGSLFLLFFSYKLLKVWAMDKSFFKTFFTGLFSVGIMYLFIHYVLSPIPYSGFLGVLYFGAIFSVFFVFYFALLFLLRSFEREDIELFKKILNRLGYARDKLVTI
jgi:O-antigen/teichoic acid export membrane protein